MPVALKMVNAIPGGQDVLLNEVRLARRITHPAVCRVFDIGAERGPLFLSIGLGQGEDLATLIHHVGRLPSEKASEFRRQMCDALAAGRAPPGAAVGRALDGVDMRAWRQDPRQRPGAAAEMGASLAAASGRSPASRRRIWAAATAFGIAAALLALVWPFDVRGGAHTLT